MILQLIRSEGRQKKILDPSIWIVVNRIVYYSVFHSYEVFVMIIFVHKLHVIYYTNRIYNIIVDKVQFTVT